MPYRLPMAVTLAVFLGLLSGCGEAGPKRVHVSGSVQMDGKPLSQGEIYFMEPAAGKPPDVLHVTDGKFEGMVQLGKKRVEVHSPKQIETKPGTVQMGPPLVVNLVHDNFNTNSKLTAEVTESGLNPSNFEVKRGSGTARPLLR
jgi:hypothetical protein